MPYVSTPERVGKLIGILETIRVILRNRFGQEGAALTPELEDVPSHDDLIALAEALLNATDLAEARQAIATARQLPPRKKRRRN